MTEVTPESLRQDATLAASAAEVLGDVGFFRRSQEITAAATALRAAADEIERLTAENAKLTAQFYKVAALADRAVTIADVARSRYPFAKFNNQHDGNTKP